ncbi:MAG: outer membrane protein assembly factor BamB [Polaromonas sp.]
MNKQYFWPVVQYLRLPIAIISIAALGGCFGGVKKPQPAELQPLVALVSARQSWTSRIGPVNFPLEASVSGSSVGVAGGDGSVALLDARTGGDIWRLALNTPIAAGVGSDGKVLAVVTRANEVVAMQDGRELWRSRLASQAFTAPFVAGGRVFVLAADRSVNAFDGQTGRKLWTQQRPNEPLVLRQSGVILAVGDTLVVGLSGRLAGLNPSNGSVRWEVPVASPRGINDVERLVDLVGPVSRVADSVCVRAFQASVGCVNAAGGSLLWTKPANGMQGIGGDDRLLFGTEADGTVLAWRRADGERVWSTDRLRHRGLTAPLLAGRSVAMGDATGFIHLLSREDGTLLNRLSTDGSAIAAAPVLAGSTLVAVTHNGGVYGFQPE